MTRMGRPIKDNAKRASVTIRMSDETNKKLKEYAVSPLFNIIEGGNQYGKGTKRRARQSA